MGYMNGEYVYLGADTNLSPIPATDRNIKTENLQYICGGTTEETAYVYAVASRSVGVYSGEAFFSMSSREAGFNVACVDVVGVGTNLALCDSGADGGYDRGNSVSVPVRPVVVLPSDLKVEDTTDGYDLIQEDGEQIPQ